MNPHPDPDSIDFRTDFTAEDVDTVIQMHAELYGLEYGYTQQFEQYVALGIKDFQTNYQPARDRMWLAMSGSEVVGAIVIVGRSGRVAQLRYFILHPKVRGLGIGRKLMAEAIQFCKKTGYHSVYLWTTSELHAAAHLYKAFGFERTLQVEKMQWGKLLTEDCYDLTL